MSPRLCVWRLVRGVADGWMWRCDGCGCIAYTAELMVMEPVPNQLPRRTCQRMWRGR